MIARASAIISGKLNDRDFNSNYRFIIDEDGNLQFIFASVAGSKLGLFSIREYVEVPWSYVTKIGANVIVVSADKEKIKRARA